MINKGVEISMKETEKTIGWKMTGLVVLVLPILGAIPIILLNGSGNISEAGGLAPLLILLSICCAVMSVICFFKVKGWNKLIPVFGLLTSLGLAFLAQFTYWISGIQF